MALFCVTIISFVCPPKNYNFFGDKQKDKQKTIEQTNYALIIVFLLIQVQNQLNGHLKLRLNTIMEKEIQTMNNQ